jgi:hypothetical protein
MSGKRQIEERKFLVELFNSLLPQEKYYDEEFETEIIVAVGGIHDSEYMFYVYDNIDLYGRMKSLRNL